MDKLEIVSLIKKAKKYKNISEEVIGAEFDKFVKRNPRWTDFKEKHILKEIKRQLHKIHGSFHFLDSKDINRREEFLQELEKNPKKLEIIQKILSTNKSTKERLEKYEEVYKEIFEITGKPKSIVDLGCGLNPLSFIFMKLNNIYYNAYEINKEDVKVINEYFKTDIKKIVDGKAEIMDCSRLENLKTIPDSDVCFMFKFIDPVEKAYGHGHKLSEEIIQTLKDKYKFMVVSFATRTVGGNEMNFPYRGWIERMLRRIEMNYDMIDFSQEIGEVFYVISKPKN